MRGSIAYLYLPEYANRHPCTAANCCRNSRRKASCRRKTSSRRHLINRSLLACYLSLYLSHPSLLSVSLSQLQQPKSSENAKNSPWQSPVTTWLGSSCRNPCCGRSIKVEGWRRSPEVSKMDLLAAAVRRGRRPRLGWQRLAGRLGQELVEGIGRQERKREILGFWQQDREVAAASGKTASWQQWGARWRRSSWLISGDDRRKEAAKKWDDAALRVLLGVCHEQEEGVTREKEIKTRSKVLHFPKCPTPPWTI